MSITAQLSDDAQQLLIRIQGRFDFAAHQAFRQAYEAHYPARYVIDLEAVDYLDSSALGMLLLLRDHAGGDAAKIRLINCSDDVRKVLSISNFTQLFNVG